MANPHHHRPPQSHGLTPPFRGGIERTSWHINPAPRIDPHHSQLLPSLNPYGVMVHITIHRNGFVNIRPSYSYQTVRK